MNKIEHIQEFIIRYGYHPLRTKNIINFKDIVQNARQIKIFCPTYKVVNNVKQLLNKHFKTAKIYYLVPEYQKVELTPKNELANIIYVTKNSIWKTKRQGHMIPFKNISTDIYLDLCTEPNMLSYYFSRHFAPKISIGFQKPFSKNYYNLEFKFKNDQNLPDNTKKLIQFISDFL